MNIFFTPDISGKTYTLNENESKHCIRVLRHGVGDMLTLTDGKGGWFHARIIDANPKKCKVQVENHIIEHEKRNYYLHVAIAPTKNTDRFEWFLEKATEIGIDEITPLFCENSERKHLKTERLEKVMVAAMKQSLKAYLPKLNNLTNFETFIKSKQSGSKYIAHCAQGEKKHLFKVLKPACEVLILIGPEGDFAENEIEMALHHNFKSISLGTSRLRTETAGVSAVQIVNVVNEMEQ